MSEQHFQPQKPRFFNRTVAGHEAEPSPELRALAQDFARELASEYNDRKKGCYDLLKRYPNDEYLKQQWTDGNIEKFASGEDDTAALERLRGKPFDEVTWGDVHDAAAQDIEKATLCLNAVFDGAYGYIAMGLYAADAIGFKSPFERGQFSVIRNGFIDDWQPRGAVESGLVDMLAQTYVAWQYWLSRSFSIANNEDTVSEQKTRTKKPYDDAGQWQPMRLSYAEHLERATQMVDRFQRMYLRTLRQMRDLRRYSSPVVIQNAGQVNVAADGGQQVNVQNKRKKKGTKARGVTGPRRLKAVK
jgi:hypothetical protein